VLARRRNRPDLSAPDMSAEQQVNVK
jgi:hypothetical protein